MSNIDRVTFQKQLPSTVVAEESDVDQGIDDELRLFLARTNRVLADLRLLSQAEQTIITNINASLKSWHQRWIDAFLADGREFNIVYGFMEHLMHYEQQITSSVAILSNDRVNAIAQAVARIIDCGNATLNIDLIVRADDDTSSELDFSTATTIQLFKAHLKAQKLREKLLNDYLREEKRASSTSGIDDSFMQLSLGTSLLNLQLPNTHSALPSPTLDRSLGSNQSINTLSDGRRTPLSGFQIEVKKLDPVDLSDQLDITHMTATIRSKAFASCSSTRMAFLPGILANIEDLFTVPTSAEKLSRCFELLDSLLDTLESLSVDQRSQEVTSVAIALLKPLVRKVYIDDRESLIDFQHAHWVAALVSLLRLMSPTDFSSFLNHFNNLADLGAFLKDFLFIIKRLMTNRDRTVKSAHSQPDIESLASLGGLMFPECWIDMILMACSTFLRSLTNLYQILKQLFSSNIQMWSNFIDCLIGFNLYDSLKHERFMLKERQRLLASDIRQMSAEYVWITWDSLSVDQKQNLLDDFVDPLIMACICMDSRQRSILLPIFYDMMHCDYTSQYITRRNHSDCSSSSTFTPSIVYSDFNFSTKNEDAESLPPIIERSSSKSPTPAPQTESLPYLNMCETSDTRSEDGTVLTRFTHMTVGKLNNLMIEQNLGDESFKYDLCAAIGGELNPKYSKRRSFEQQDDSDRFKTMAKLTSDLLSEFIQICLDYRRAKELSYKHLELLCLFRLTQFFKDKVDRTELYLHNLFKLCSLHHKAERYVESALTLLEYAKTLPWSDRSTGSHQRVISRHFQIAENYHTLGGFKSILYSTIIEYFDQGELWEAAVPLCRELMDLYQFKTFEYAKLSTIFLKLSNYFRNITETGLRSNPEYFRVSFYGLGFPSCLRDTTMVYRGKPFEKLGDFQASLLTEYPDATLFHSLAKPDLSTLSDPRCKLLQINACTPVVDLVAKFGNNLHKMDESALSYYKHNECDKFQFSRRIAWPQSLATRTGCDEEHSKPSGDNFADIWRERTTLTCNTLPGMLPFFPVYLVETSIISPIECAIEDLERTNDRLSCMVNRFKADKRHAEDIRLLGQLLLGVVDAAVNGGVAKYEEAFFSSTPIPAQRRRNATRSSSEGKPGSGPVSEALYVSLSNDSDDVDFSLYSKQVSGNNAGHYEQPTNETNMSASPTGTCLQAESVTACKPTETQVDKLKCLIARQVPLLDVAIRLHGDRVADIMRPQQEHLESSYRKLKQHVITKYSRYLPADYKRSSMSSSSNMGTFRSYRSMHRSPNRSMRLTPNHSGLNNTTGSPSSARRSNKRMSDVGLGRLYNLEPMSSPSDSSTCNIPYQQLGRARRSLPFLSGLPKSANAGQTVTTPISRPLPPPPPTSTKSNHLYTEEVNFRPVLPPPRISIEHASAMQPEQGIVKSAYKDIQSLLENISNQESHGVDHDDDNGDDEPILSANTDDDSAQVQSNNTEETEEVKLVYL